MFKPSLPVVFALDGDVTPAELFGAIGAGLGMDVVAGRRGRVDRTYLDTFDGRLRAAGIELERHAGSNGTDALTLGERGGQTTTLEVDGGGNGLFVDALPAGLARNRLRDIVEMRALLPQATVASTVAPAVLRDGEGKTVVRLTWERPSVRRPAKSAAVLGARLHVAPVRGYERAHDQVVRFLRRQRGLAVARSSLADAAVTAAGGVVGGVSARPAVTLAPGMRADDATFRICRRLAEIVEANVAGVLADVDTEFLHDLRVAVRRTRSVLRELPGVFDPGEWARARNDLRWVQEVTGPTRDLDVHLLEWPGVMHAVPAPTAADLEPLHAVLARHRATAWEALCVELRGARYRDAWSAWRAVLARPQRRDDPDAPPDASRPVIDVAGRRVATVYRRMVADGRAIDDATPPQALHDLRKRGKELRYLLELFGSLWPDAAVGPLVSTLKGLQDVLGRFQDDDVQAAFLRSLGPEVAGQTGGPAALIAVGTLVKRLVDDQAVARRDFAARFAPFAAGPTRKLVQRTFAPRP